MPVLASSAYVTAEDVLNRIRVILNDSEVAGGDVLTDSAPYTFTLLDSAFERVQIELASVGVETLEAETWLIGLPIMPSTDPEARMIIDDSGTRIIYPNGVGNTFASSPILPVDLVMPMYVKERQTNTTQEAVRMFCKNDGLLSLPQQNFLIDYQWRSDGLYTRGALQSQDLKIVYEKQLAKLAAATDPVPIRGVTNAAAYFGAELFAKSRGGVVSAQFKLDAMEEIFLLKQVAARRRQRKQVRRRPYSGRGNNSQSPI